MSAYRQAHATCVHHAGVPAARACRKCDEALCEPCCAFVVNDDIWCAVCGEELQGEGRTGQAVVRIATLVGVCLVVGFFATAHVRWGRVGTTLACAVMVVTTSFFGQFVRLQRLRSGPRVLHSPKILRRKPGDALPRIPSWVAVAPRPTEATPASAGARAGRPPA